MMFVGEVVLKHTAIFLNYEILSNKSSRWPILYNINSICMYRIPTSETTVSNFPPRLPSAIFCIVSAEPSRSWPVIAVFIALSETQILYCIHWATEWGDQDRWWDLCWGLSQLQKLFFMRHRVLISHVNIPMYLCTYNVLYICFVYKRTQRFRAARETGIVDVAVVLWPNRFEKENNRQNEAGHQSQIYPKSNWSHLARQSTYIINKYCNFCLFQTIK